MAFENCKSQVRSYYSQCWKLSAIPYFELELLRSPPHIYSKLDLYSAASIAFFELKSIESNVILPSKISMSLCTGACMTTISMTVTAVIWILQFDRWSIAMLVHGFSTSFPYYRYIQQPHGWLLRPHAATYEGQMLVKATQNALQSRPSRASLLAYHVAKLSQVCISFLEGMRNSVSI